MNPITCKICNKVFKGQITGLHLKTHGINSAEYQSKYGPTKDPAFLDMLKAAGTAGGKSFSKATQANKEAKLNRISDYDLDPKKCSVCSKPLSYKQHIERNKFCSSSCGTSNSNRNKKSGIRRSQLEVYLCEQLSSQDANYSVISNSKLGGLEFDILVDNKFAIEINGPVHYQPLWGQEKLDRIKLKDTEKVQFCLNNNLSLLVIDTSAQLRFTTDSSKPYLEEILRFLRSG